MQPTKYSWHIFKTGWLIEACDLSLYFLYLCLELLHKADGIRQCLSLVPGQCLQIQDGLCALGLQDSDGLQQPLVTDTRESGVRHERQRKGPRTLFNPTLAELCSASNF